MFTKIFSTFDNTVIKQCQYFTSVLPIGYYYIIRKVTFIKNLLFTNNVVILTLHNTVAKSEISTCAVKFKCEEQNFNWKYRSIVHAILKANWAYKFFIYAHIIGKLYKVEHYWLCTLNFCTSYCLFNWCVGCVLCVVCSWEWIKITIQLLIIYVIHFLLQLLVNCIIFSAIL